MLSQFNLLPITIFLIILYLLSYFLYVDKNITARTYKLLWIIVLIVSSLFVGIVGIIMLLLINFNLLPIDNTLVFWHVEAGIITAVTGIFHVHIHWKSVKKIF
jgi:hypothetical protein